ncbi:MAG: hypothetical protein NXI20_17750 [bacterium]|nr:hypothetical protein [bacterium]
MKYLITILSLVAILSACSNDEDTEPQLDQRTITLNPLCHQCDFEYTNEQNSQVLIVDATFDDSQELIVSNGFEMTIHMINRLDSAYLGYNYWMEGANQAGHISIGTPVNAEFDTTFVISW